ncbi:2-dehydro-3-deoxygalactonokinase [Reichenbachiella ulvae]|uniref:2-dehydro-3-deoxygalactonokinase n=1 Tax=Reichenbachiella ulvae TaxID=2980104 RepID=A0ABT3D0L3_9BACT|nr:2-dehydro-3-deoxygalactonokinase [Reichenbachiella ulvae]MCV9389495.1 2-dehydro-3-deoxygalactonokinase [Reichenbachiella ulvae]
MSVSEYFISCDWGTSNFRLRLVESQTLKVCYEHRTSVGVKSLHEQYIAQGGGDQLQFFADYLSRELTHFPEGSRAYQIVACGMASANIGLKNLAYASLPITADGQSLLAESLTLNGLQILLVSGVKAQDSMMRGEEIQAVGLAGHLQHYEQAILLAAGRIANIFTTRMERTMCLVPI